MSQRVLKHYKYQHLVYSLLGTFRVHSSTQICPIRRHLTQKNGAGMTIAWSLSVKADVYHNKKIEIQYQISQDGPSVCRIANNLLIPLHRTLNEMNAIGLLTSNEPAQTKFKPKSCQHCSHDSTTSEMDAWKHRECH